MDVHKPSLSVRLLKPNTGLQFPKSKLFFIQFSSKHLAQRFERYRAQPDDLKVDRSGFPISYLLTDLFHLHVYSIPCFLSILENKEANKNKLTNENKIKTQEIPLYTEETKYILQTKTHKYQQLETKMNKQKSGKIKKNMQTVQCKGKNTLQKYHCVCLVLAFYC